MRKKTWKTAEFITQTYITFIFVDFVHLTKGNYSNNTK